MSVVVSYYANLDVAHFVRGFEAGDPLTLVGAITLPADTPNPEEAAFVYFQRIDDPHPVLDAAEAPSMSVGDVVSVRTGEAVSYHAVSFVGFADVAEADLHIEPRNERSVAQMREQWEAADPDRDRSRTHGWPG